MKQPLTRPRLSASGNEDVRVDKEKKQASASRRTSFIMTVKEKIYHKTKGITRYGDAIKENRIATFSSAKPNANTDNIRVTNADESLKIKSLILLLLTTLHYVPPFV